MTYLDKVLQEQPNISEQELKEYIRRKFKGFERTGAVLEYCDIFRKFKHKRWVKQLEARSQSKDIFKALEEWGLMNDRTNISIFPRAGGVSCELDATVLKKVFIYENKKNGEHLRIGSRCAEKIVEKNIFGDASKSRSRRGGEGDNVNWDVDMRDMLMWLNEKKEEGTLPGQLSDIVGRIITNEFVEILDSEFQQILQYYDNTREFKPSELVGEVDLFGLRKALVPFKLFVPRSLDDVLFSDVNITRAQGEPLVAFIYEDGKRIEILKDILDKVRSDKDSRRALDRMRMKLNIPYENPGLHKMGELVLRYIKDYQEVNFGKRTHKLTGLELPISMFNSGLIMSEEEAERVANAYRRHKNYTKAVLVDERDDRHMERRKEEWAAFMLQDRSLRRDLVNQFFVNIEAAIDDSTFGDDIWKVINGVTKTIFANSRTGYVTKSGMYASRNSQISESDVRDLLHLNLKRFFSAGYLGNDFTFNDKKICDKSQDGNLPSVFIGESRRYYIPKRIYDVADEDAQRKISFYEDGRKVIDQKEIDRERRRRKRVLDFLPDLIMDVVMDFRYELRTRK